MKKNMKWTALALSAIMTLGAVSGCGEKAATTGDQVDVVTIWTVNSHSEKVMKELWQEFNETVGKEKGIQVDYQVKPGDSMAQNLELALKSGTAPDFFGSGDMMKLADNGDIMAIEDLPGGAEYLKTYEGKLDIDRHIHKEKTYRVPTSASPGGLIYNKDLFKAAGIVDENGEAKAPRTYDEIREYAKKLTNPDEKTYGIIYPLKWDGWYSSDIIVPMMSSQGFEQYNPATGKIDYSNFGKVFELFLGMKEDGSVYPGAESLDNDSARALFAEGKIGMKFGFNFDVGVLNDQFPAKCDWGVVPYPVWDENAPVYPARMDYGNSNFINAKSKVPAEKLMEVLKYQTSDEFLIAEYENGTSMPYDWNIVKDVVLGADAKKGWKEFSEIIGVSGIFPRAPKQDFAGLRKPQDIFVQDIYSGKVSIEEGIAEIEKNANQAIDNYYETHPEESKDEFYIPDWKPVAIER